MAENGWLKYYKYALKYAMILTRDKYAAEELVQDVYLKILKNNKEVNDKDQPKGYLTKAIKNTFITQYRKDQKSMQDSLPENSANIGSPVVQDHSFGDYSDETTRALNSLDLKFRRPLLLHVQGYKYEEISKMTGINLGTIKNHIFRAKKMLQERLAKP